MGLYKLTKTKASMVCPCGFENEFDIKDLKAGKNRVAFPVCTGCKKMRTFIFCSEGDLDSHSDDSKARRIINRTLHKRLVDQEQFEDGVTADSMSDGIHEYALEAEIVEAPLHSKILAAKIKKEKEKTK